MISNEEKEQVRKATNFRQLVEETTPLRPRGHDLWGCCPFHQEKTPSFKINEQSGLFHCFGCGKSGDVFKYIEYRENLDFLDAVRYLADRANIELHETQSAGPKGPKRSRLIDLCQATADFYHHELTHSKSEGAQAARAYLGGRGLGLAICKKWQLGYAPGRGQLRAHLRKLGFSDAEMIAANVVAERTRGLSDVFYNRVVFPINDEQGRPVAFGARSLEAKPQGPKYINSRDTPLFSKGKMLFAYDRAKATLVTTGTAIVCEGYTDVISMHEAGFTNAVAALGTAFRLEHIRLLERQHTQRIICMFDGDAAGQRAAERAVRYIDKTTAELLCVVLPNNQDPMEFLSTHAPEALQSELDRARPLMDFVFDKYVSADVMSSPAKRLQALNAMVDILAPLKDSLLLDEYATRLANALQFNVNDVRQRIIAAPVLHDDEQERTAKQAPVSPEDSYEFYEYGVPPIDYTPQDMQPAPSLSWDLLGRAPISQDLRLQIQAERELLSNFVTASRFLRPYITELLDISWSDSQVEAMAFAMFSTPEYASPQDILAAARSALPDADRLLGGGELSRMALDLDATRARIIVLTLEFYAYKVQVGEKKSVLLDQQLPEEEMRQVMSDLHHMQQKINELGKELSRVGID